MIRSSANVALRFPAVRNSAAPSPAPDKNAPILILDDSLSAVDTDTEEHILHNLRDDRKGKTTILIAHRISTVQHADLIMVLENGEMKELGTHTELIQKNGIYKDMFEKQQLEASIGEQEVAIR